MNKTILVLLAVLLVLAACTSNKAQETQAVQQAEQWVQNAPTYAYDGQNLELIDYYVQESDPERHVVTFEFSSRQAGYGDRSNQAAAQVITDHVIIVTIVEQEIQSAVIDGRWDELNQREIDGSRPVNNPEEPVNSSADQETNSPGVQTLSFQPMQCEEYAWDEWYAAGEIQYVDEPTTQQLITDYYAQEHAIELDVERVDTDQIVCQACSVCQTSHYFRTTMTPVDADVLEADGWQ